MFVKKILTNKLLLIPIFFIAVSGGVVAMNVYRSSINSISDNMPEVNDANYDYRTEKAIMSKQFAAKSSKDVYTIFKTRYSKMNSITVHNLAHWIGTEIYLHSGIDGLLICDEAFSYGCYHGFFIKAFEKEGKNLYQSGDKYCSGDGSQPLKFGGCIHGLGHGVLYLNGYDLDGLNNALKDCESLSSQSSIMGCNNGVFMEYNTRTMQSLDSGEVKVRELDPNDKLYPCSQLELKYQSDCVFEIPAWWANVLSNDFKEMINICASIKNSEVKKWCHGGVGRIVPVSDNYQWSRVKDVCLLIKENDNKSHCIEKSLEVLLSLGKADSMSLCDSLDSATAKGCRDRMNQYYCVITDKCRTKQ